MALVPILILLLLALGCRETPAPTPAERRMMLFTILACLAGFPLALMATVGETDYRRPADVLVVFGAMVRADGRPSLALEDRARTACRLYRQGLAPRLYFSGGPGKGSIHETEAMRRIAIAMGVPSSAIFLDPSGLDTRATAEHAVAFCRQHRLRRVLAVSHDYHLPRVKLAFRCAGLHACTVPAQESRRMVKKPYLVAREVAALWWYYLAPQ